MLFRSLMIDEAKNQELLAKYKIEAFPTFVVLNSQGREAARATGALTAERFVEFVDYANAVLTVEKIPDDADALYRRGRWGVLYAPTLEQKREQVDAALRAVGETEKEKRARLLVAKAMLADSAKAGEVPEEAYKHLREARQLDADNGFGVREEADYFILALEASQQKDEAALRKAVADYFAKYPPNKLRDRNIAMQLLEVQFQLQVKAADYAAAISTLETTKALVDDPKVKQYVDGLIADVRKEQEKAAAKD